MGKFFLLTSFFIITPLLFIISVLFFSFLSYQKHPFGTFSFLSPSPIVAYAALPTTQSIPQEEIMQEDARTEMVRQFFAKYKSPLEPFAKEVISSADTYNLDFRLIPAIAMQESNLCSRIPIDSHNCWGFGIYGGKVTTFENFPTAIETVTRTLARNYKAKGLETPEQIMKKYTPSSNGSWARGVNHFMEVLQ